MTSVIRRAAAAAAAFSTVFLVSVSSSPAEDPGKGVGALVLSARVADYGRAAKDPLSLIVAASIRSRVATRRIDRRPEGGDGAAEVGAGGSEPGVEALLDEAVSLSGKDPAIAAMADDIRASKTKGRVDGVAESVATVKGAGIDWYRKVAFEGTRYAEAYAELIGDGRLSISVWDEGGNLVCKDPNPSTYSYCGWNPSATGRYDVKIENLGSKPVRYRISTN